MSITWIEASAGTGKTYTLVRTVLRLIAEGLPVERILMVTFTDKATAELKTRIREGLREEWKSTRDEKLALALENLSAMTIATIHGFCRLLLTQFPLESGVSFSPELVDQGSQWRRLLREELRPRLAGLDAGLLAWAGVEDEEELMRQALEALNRNVFSLPLLHPDENERGLFARYRSALEARTGPLWDALPPQEELPEDSEAGLGAQTIAEQLHKSWHKKPYAAVRALLSAATFRELLPLLGDDTLKELSKWDEGGSAWKKGGAAVTPRLQAIQTLAAGFAAAAEAWTSALPEGVDLRSFLSGAARYEVLQSLCLPVLARRSARELTYHDLIERVRTLVTGGSGLKAAAERWSAVLIDEFQDTDPEQWDIFRSLFADHRLFLVGDPKQSIYRFRGADLDVYRAVGREVRAAGAQTLVLEENFRSTAPMIEAVNALFDPRKAAWDHPSDFTPSRKGDKEVGQLVLGGMPVEPLAVYQDSDDRLWHRHLVNTVVTMLGTHGLQTGAQTRALTPGDFLILVRKKREAWTLYRLLTAQGVPAAVGGSGGLLKGREAQEILLFLKALEHPRSVSALQALAWTRLLAGASVEQLAPALEEAQADRDRGAYLRAFRRVAASLEPSVSDGGGLEHLLGLPEGKRIVTNAEHVLELVQERHHRGDFAPGHAALALETWIQGGLEEDEVDLRRDSEAPTLRLLTIHAAKGLEAPIVLHGRPAKPAADRGLWYITSGADFLRTAESRALEKKSRAAEELRLQYVALTRARTHQVFQSPEGSLSVPDSPLASRWTPPQPTPVPSLAPPLEGLWARHPWVESHSGLWKRATREHAVTWDKPLVSRDEEEETPDLSDELPAGPVFGDLVHDILEGADFRAWDPHAPEATRTEARTLVETQAQRHRGTFGRDISRPLHEWLGRTLNARFALEQEELRFSSLEPQDTRRELEFHLPLTVEGPEREFHWGGRTFTVHRGFLTGRIDLLFRWKGKLYLADWKTNRLAPGQQPADLMREAGYDLQAQWYWHALRRLSRVTGDPHELGGVLYVFLRGAGDQPQGVFLPPPELDAVASLSPFFKEAAGG